MNFYVTSVKPDPDESKNFTIFIDGKKLDTTFFHFEKEFTDGEDGYPYPTGRTIVHLKFYGEIEAGNL